MSWMLIVLGLYCAACWGITASLVFTNPIGDTPEDAWDDFWVTLFAPVVLPFALFEPFFSQEGAP